MDLLGRARTLVRIVEAGSFSAAARSLGVSLAAVSRQVTSLEDELGARLLVRTTRRLRLTEEGRRFHEHAARLVREADAALASVRRGGEVGGELVVSASVTLGVLRILPGLGALLDAHPALAIDLRLEDREADLVAEGIDVAVRAGLALPDTTGLVAHALATFSRVLVASPGYLRKHGAPRSVAALAGHAAIGGAGATAWAFTEDGEEVVARPTTRLRVGTLIGRREAARAGGGLAVLPDFVVADALADRSLRALLPRATLAPVRAHALHRVELRGVKRVEVVLAHLRAVVPRQ